MTASFSRRIASLVLSLSFVLPALSAAELPASAEATTPLKTGDAAPSFTVKTVDNRAFMFDPAVLERPVIFISFRGGWCPYCNLHLSELRNVVPKIADLDVDIYFLSGDRPEQLYASLQRETQEDIAGLDYVILSDAHIDAALAFGTAFQVGDSTVKYLDRKGRDIDGSSIASHGALAVPAVYVIDTSGTIVFDFVNPDYKVRVPADELLAAAERVSKQ